MLERDEIMKRFQEVTAQLEQALSGISFENLDISDEVKEQVWYICLSAGILCRWNIFGFK